MGLSGQQRKQLQEALIAAFPTTASLEQMLSLELNKNLRAIAAEGSLQYIVFQLIQAADSQGWVEKLICAAYDSNSGNQELQSFLQKLSLKKSNDLRAIIESQLECEYDNVEELGTGAFGITYLATVKNQDKYLVIKTIKLEELYKIVKSNNQETLKVFNQLIKSFEKEADILSRFEHPNIVKYYDYFTRKFNLIISFNDQNKKLYSVYELELLFLVMEYIEGESLEDFISNRSVPLEEAEALRYVQQIGNALILVHSQGVLHRDIKPQNIMVRKATFDAVLIDFGIAREFNPTVTQTHTVAFTEGYAPPEQLNPKAKRGNYTDIYGLAATLFYLLTKEHPRPALLRSIQPLDEPKKLNSNISDMVNQAILWGMELEFSKRPQTVQQWLAKFPSKEARVELKPLQRIAPVPISIKPPSRNYRKKKSKNPDDNPNSSLTADPVDTEIHNGVNTQVIEDSQKLLEAIFSSLNNCYHTENWWDRDNKFQICIEAILSQGTTWKKVESVINNLRDKNLLTPNAIYEISLDYLCELIKPFGSIKASYMKNFVFFLKEDYELNLEQMLVEETTQLRSRLLKIKGIGEFTCDNILLYAADKRKLPINNRIRKVFFEHDLIESITERYDSVQRRIESIMPFTTSSQIRQFDELIYRVARDYCHSTPQCEECPLKQLLDTQGPRSQRKQQEDGKSSDSFAAALCADRNVDYTRLRDLLAARKWKEADQETLAVMLKATGREEEGWLSSDSISNFPCTDLRTIDQLWVKYSNGRFGFSVQKRIWESVGGKLDADLETWKAWGERVGWYVNNKWCRDLQFDQNAPSGQLPKLPTRIYPRNTKQNMKFRGAIFSRIETHIV